MSKVKLENQTEEENLDQEIVDVVDDNDDEFGETIEEESDDDSEEDEFEDTTVAFNIDDITARVTENKTLSDEDIEAIKAEYPELVANALIKDLKSTFEVSIAEIKEKSKEANSEVFASDEEYNSFKKWIGKDADARKELSELFKTDPAAYKLRARELRVDFRESGQASPSNMPGGSNGKQSRAKVTKKVSWDDYQKQKKAIMRDGTIPYAERAEKLDKLFEQASDSIREAGKNGQFQAVKDFSAFI